MKITAKPHTFLACDKPYKEASIAIFGAPFDGTQSNRPGARFAPNAMREESYALETYSPYLDKDLVDKSIFDGGDLQLVFGNAKESLSIIQKYVSQLINDGKTPVMIGGEHLVTLGAFRAILAKYPDIRVVHFDAHTDLREDFFGEKLSHATVIRRIWEEVGDNRIYQFGIRSGEKEEFVFAKEHTQLTQFSFDNLKTKLEGLKGYPVYLTIDLDVLDPSLFCGTGTPEAGGVSFNELIKAISEVCNYNVVGADINELAPMYDISAVSTATACKVLRELLLLL